MLEAANMNAAYLSQCHRRGKQCLFFFFNTNTFTTYLKAVLESSRVTSTLLHHPESCYIICEQEMPWLLGCISLIALRCRTKDQTSEHLMHDLSLSDWPLKLKVLQKYLDVLLYPRHPSAADNGNITAPHSSVWRGDLPKRTKARLRLWWMIASQVSRFPLYDRQLKGWV